MLDRATARQLMRLWPVVLFSVFAAVLIDVAF